MASEATFGNILPHSINSATSLAGSENWGFFPLLKLGGPVHCRHYHHHSLERRLAAASFYAR